MSDFNGGYIGKGGVIDALIGHDFDGFDEVNASNGTSITTSGGIDTATFSAAIDTTTGLFKSTASQTQKDALNNFLRDGRYYIKNSDGTFSKITAKNIDDVKFDTIAGKDNGNVYLAKGTRTGVVGLEKNIDDVVNNTKVVSASDALTLQLEFIKYSTQITAASQMTKTVGDSMNATVHNIG